MNITNMHRAFAIVLGLFIIGFAGLYYCGWEAVVDLINYARCDWLCAESSDIAWGVFRLMPMLEFFIGLGTWVFILGAIRP